MIYFGVETDQEVKENGHVGPTQIKKKKNKKRRKRSRRGMLDFLFIFIFFLLSLLSSIYGNRTVRIRRGKKQSALLNEGYA